VREAVPTKWSISGREPHVAAEIALDAKKRGFVKMKVKVASTKRRRGATPRRAEAIGDDIVLGVDANGGWKSPTSPSR